MRAWGHFLLWTVQGLYGNIFTMYPDPYDEEVKGCLGWFRFRLSVSGFAELVDHAFAGFHTGWKGLSQGVRSLSVSPRANLVSGCRGLLFQIERFGSYRMKPSWFSTTGWRRSNIGTLIVRIGFGGTLYYTYNKDPQNSLGNHKGFYSKFSGLLDMIYIGYLEVHG